MLLYSKICTDISNKSIKNNVNWMRMHNSSQRHKQSYSMDWAFFCRESDLPGNFPLSILWNPSLSRNSSINLKVSNTENSITTIKRQFHQTSILEQHLQTTNGLLRGTQFPVWKWIFNSKTQPNIQFQHLALQWSIFFYFKEWTAMQILFNIC